MTKAILMSIRPQHAINILNGKKTLELRTWIPKDYVGWVYVYVTKGKPYLGKNIDGYYGLYNIPYFGHFNKVGDLNGTIPFRFWFDEYIELEHYDFWDESYYWKNTVLSAFELEKATCMSSLEMEEYAKGKTLYAWHIKKLGVFDTPKELSEFYKFKKKWIYSGMDCPPYVDEVKTRLSKAPQRSVWVYKKEKENE